MSGGVDSSVTAALLKEQGYEVIGMTMQIWDYSKFTAPDGASFGSCCSIDDVYDARRVANCLDIPFYVVNFEDAFQGAVIDPFCDDYLAGKTPNPCTLCNQEMKFDLLLKRAIELEADYLATGHYVQLVDEAGELILKKGLDENKDQSYFLFPMTTEQMPHLLFPLGGMTKSEVRAHATRFDLPVAQKRESQDICFVPDGNYVRFLTEERNLKSQPGDIVHVNGKKLGSHQGIFRYTIGQRKGLGLSWSSPLYVIGIDPDGNRVIVGEKQYLDVSSFSIDRCNWLTEVPTEFNASVRIRYRHQETPARIIRTENGAEITFDSPQRGVTPGQAAVIYDGDRVLGGGWVTR